MEALYVIVGIVVVAIVGGAVLMGIRRREAARSRERDDLAGEIAQFNATRKAGPVSETRETPSAKGTPTATGSPVVEEERFRKPGVPQRDVDPLNDRSKSLRDRWDGSGRKR